MVTAYYNENDPKKAAWLRELIKAGAITDGEVDERSIEDIAPSDVMGFTRCHWFAGIGVWDYVLRCAGWPNDRPVWTGSCPCQPFSAAGKRKGTADERHLWPAWFHLISVCRPATIFAEQVASKDGLIWLDIVHADLEGQGYAVGALDLCAAGFGAPHIRQRLYIVADATSEQFNGGGDTGKKWGGESTDRSELGDTIEQGLQGHIEPQIMELQGRTEEDGPAWSPSISIKLGNPDRAGQQTWNSVSVGDDAQPQQPAAPGPCNGFWSDAVWLPCQDGQARPTGVDWVEHTIGAWISGRDQREAGTARAEVCQQGNGASSADKSCHRGEESHQQARPTQSCPEQVADGIADDLGLVRLESYPDRPHEERLIVSPLIKKGKARVMRLRGYGDAIVAPVATEFIRAYMDATIGFATGIRLTRWSKKDK